MVDLLPKERRDPLVVWAKTLLSQGKGPVEIIKAVREKEGCSLAAAKDIYIAAAHNETLFEYQGKLLGPLEEVLNELEVQNDGEKK